MTQDWVVSGVIISWKASGQQSYFQNAVLSNLCTGRLIPNFQLTLSVFSRFTLFRLLLHPLRQFCHKFVHCLPARVFIGFRRNLVCSAQFVLFTAVVNVIHLVISVLRTTMEGSKKFRQCAQMLLYWKGGTETGERVCKGGLGLDFDVLVLVLVNFVFVYCFRPLLQVKTNSIHTTKHISNFCKLIWEGGNRAEGINVYCSERKCGSSEYCSIWGARRLPPSSFHPHPQNLPQIS